MKKIEYRIVKTKIKSMVNNANFLEIEFLQYGFFKDKWISEINGNKTNWYNISLTNTNECLSLIKALLKENPLNCRFIKHPTIRIV